MALNWALLDGSKHPVPLGEELTVMTIDSGAEVLLNIPEVGGTSKTLKETGRIWLTELRLVFVASSKSLESLSIPLASVLSTSFVQPTFSANYLVIDIKPSPGGGLTEGTRAEIRLKDQGMFGFVSALEKTRERALYMKRQSAAGDDLPVYSSPSTFASSSTSSTSTVPIISTRADASASQPLDAPPGYVA